MPGSLDPQDWALLVLDLVKHPCRPIPAEVFGIIERTLRAHYAKAVNGHPP